MPAWREDISCSWSMIEASKMIGVSRLIPVVLRRTSRVNSRPDILPASQSTKIRSGLNMRPMVKASMAEAAAWMFVTVRRRRLSPMTPRMKALGSHIRTFSFFIFSGEIVRVSSDMDYAASFFWMALPRAMATLSRASV